MPVNIEVKKVRVRSLSVDYVVVSWEIENTAEDVLDYTFQVLRSEAAMGPFDPISTELEDSYIFVDNNIKVANAFRQTHYMIRVKRKSDGAVQDFGPTDRDPPPDLTATEIRKHINLLMREFVGRRCWVLPIRTFGQRCFLPGSVMQGAIVGASRALYKGKAVKLTTKEGFTLSVTGNHPVLTSEGLVPAQAVCVGNHLVCYGRQTEVRVADNIPNRDDQYEPALAEEVFEAFSKRLQAQPTGTVGLDFHGEAEHFIGDVDVVGSYADLLPNWQLTVAQQPEEVILAATSVVQVPCACLRPANEPLHGLGLPASGDVRGRCLSPSRDEINPSPALVLRFGQPANRNSPLLECSAEAGARNASLPSQLLQSDPGAIAFDEVIDVQEFDYLGHVYDFETLTGWVVASNIVTSNCTCFDNRLKQRTRSGCQLCYDTGFVRGYHHPIESWIQFDPSANTNQQTNVGELQQQNTTARMGYFPPVKPKDLIIEPENVRWRVSLVSTTQRLRAIVHQEVQVHRVPPTDIEYAININMTVQETDSCGRVTTMDMNNVQLASGRNFTNPHTLESFESEEIPGIFSLYGTSYGEIKE